MSFLSLKIFKNGRLVKTKIFTDDQISIGSSEGLSLQLEGLSPWHALIEKKHDLFSVLDLHSETGTKLKGQAIAEETPISSGDIISLGPYEIQFFSGPPTEKAAPPQAAPPQAPSPQAPSPQAAPPQAPSPQAAPPKAPAGKRPGAVAEKPAKPLERKSPAPKTSPPPPPPSLREKAPVAKKPSAPPAESALPDADRAPAQRPSKPSEKGFWMTYAPSSKTKNLDEFIEPSIGNLIEVLVCWKERILSGYHFFKNGNVFMGSGKDCQVKFPNMIGSAPYKLLSVASGAKVYLSQGIQGLLLQGRDRETRVSHPLKGEQTVILKPYEMVRLDFNESLKVYIRLMDKPSAPPFAGLLNLKLSEAMAMFLALLLTGLLVFYGALYAPAFLAEDTKFIEKDVRAAKVIFEKQPRKVVEYKLSEKTSGANVKKKKKIKTLKKKPSVKAVKRIKRKKRPMKSPRKGKQGKIAAQAPGKKPQKKKVTVGSVRPGGSLKTGKKGSSAKTVAPDPSKVGLLGAFGGGGKLSQLDKGATGKGGLLGLAEQSTGFAGTEESYGGEGIGTKTKELGSGGRGSSLVGISGVKTKGRGLGRAGLGAGGLGQRGRMNIEFGTEDIDVTGEIDRDGIFQVLKRNQSKFERCYVMSLNEKPSIQGNLGMRWLISPSGKGRSAKAFNDQIGSSSLASCVGNVLERLNFPEPPSGQTPAVTFTFRFYL